MIGGVKLLLNVGAGYTVATTLNVVGLTQPFAVTV